MNADMRQCQKKTRFATLGWQIPPKLTWLLGVGTWGQADNNMNASGGENFRILPSQTHTHRLHVCKNVDCCAIIIAILLSEKGVSFRICLSARHKGYVMLLAVTSCKGKLGPFCVSQSFAVIQQARKMGGGQRGQTSYFSQICQLTSPFRPGMLLVVHCILMTFDIDFQWNILQFSVREVK